jgi:hypothetical protein
MAASLPERGPSTRSDTFCDLLRQIGPARLHGDAGLEAVVGEYPHDGLLWESTSIAPTGCRRRVSVSRARSASISPRSKVSAKRFTISCSCRSPSVLAPLVASLGLRVAIRARGLVRTPLDPQSDRPWPVGRVAKTRGRSEIGRHDPPWTAGEGVEADVGRESSASCGEPSIR